MFCGSFAVATQEKKKKNKGEAEIADFNLILSRKLEWLVSCDFGFKAPLNPFLQNNTKFPGVQDPAPSWFLFYPANALF